MPEDRAIDVMLAVVVMGRITPGKGQHLAARLAHECGFDLVLAGPVGPYRQPADLTAAGAHVVLPDLTDTARVVAAVTG